METLNRRALLQRSLMLGAIPPLCCSTPAAPGPALSWNGTTLTLDLRLAPELRRAGAARAVVDRSRKVNILVAHVDRHRYVALDRSCTHGGAQCTYDPGRHTLRCTSLNHAEYDLAGTLLHGRTHGNLRAYPVRLAGARLEIEFGAAA